MNLAENTPMIGELEIYLNHGNGNELFFKEKNLITKAARLAVLTTLYTSGVVSDPINSLKVGTGGTIDPAGLYPKPEDPMQIDLIVPVLTLATGQSANTSQVSVTFIADVDQTQLNGQLISEAGLFKTGGDIFNVKNHPGIPKSASFSIHYEWKIIIP